jgi:hypothetical protein
MIEDHPTKAVKVNRHVFFHYHTYILCPPYMGDTRKNSTENQTTPFYQVRKETHLYHNRWLHDFRTGPLEHH